ncbi:nitroreductase family protein [Konateibacter massiliensis]|uniref:nitroreductase family protein n=1 Tax=Konateibacter massiliensis TaxID=2002841 RepID=UPI000C15BB05|nr:nitroreductase family protein [Konateibacter massiliensis]
MDLFEAINIRHSVRAYTDKRIEGEVKKELLSCIEQCNKEGGLHMQLVLDEPKGFDGRLAHYGKFSGVKNYIAVVGKKGEGFEEKCGYYGEKVVLLAQTLGLNTCWVALTFSKVKSAYQIEEGEKLYLVISIGYGETQGVPHKSKSSDSVIKSNGAAPEWFQKGVEAALLAPTAMNQQKFVFSLNKDIVSAKAGFGVNSKIDLGIAKYHFEIGAGIENFKWA